MHIGQLARLVGLDTQTIRFYEKQGLLSPPPKRQENGYRTYTGEHVERLVFIGRCRMLNLSLAELRELLHYQGEPHQPCAAINTLFDNHIAHVRSQIAALQALEGQLAMLRSACGDGREVEACRILRSEERRVGKEGRCW